MTPEHMLLAADTLSALTSFDTGKITRDELKRAIGNAHRKFKLARGIDTQEFENE